jgi:hypothetical protein
VDKEKDFTYNEDELIQQKFDITKEEILSLNREAMHQLQLDLKLSSSSSRQCKHPF